MGKLAGTCLPPAPASNHPVERTAHSAGFVAVPGASGCGPPLTGSVRLFDTLEGVDGTITGSKSGHTTLAQ
jgi:hypothetical protein